MFCGHCGSKLKEMDIFCTECGKKQMPINQGIYSAPISDANQESYTPVASEGNNKTALGLGVIATIGVAFVILVVIGLSLIFRTNYIEVPDFSNLTEEEAIQLIEESRLTVGVITEEYSGRVEVGLVISQSPRTGREVESGTPIDLTISLGEEPALVSDFTDLESDEATDLVEDRAPNMTTVPDVIGLPTLDAVHSLEESFLLLGRIYEEYHEYIERGHVINQSLRAGTSVEEVSYVDLTISLGPEPGARTPSVSPFDLDVWGEDQIITLELNDVSVDVPIPPWLNDVVEDYRDRTEPVTDRRRGFRSDGQVMYVIEKERDDLKTMIQVVLANYHGDFLEVAQGDLNFLESAFPNQFYYVSSATATILYQSEGELTGKIIYLEYPEDGSDQLIEFFELVKFNEYNGIMIRTRLRFRAVDAPKDMCSECFADAFGLWRYIDAGYMELDE